MEKETKKSKVGNKSTIATSKEYEIFIAEVNSKTFVEKLLKLGRLGAILKPNTYPNLNNNPKTVRLFATLTEGEVGLLTSFNISFKEVVKYLTEEELQELGWDDFQREALSKGIPVGGKGRTRDTVEKEYLERAKKESGG